MATPKCLCLEVYDDTNSSVTKIKNYLPVRCDVPTSRRVIIQSLPSVLQQIFHQAGNNYFILWEQLDALAISRCEKDGIKSSKNFHFLQIIKEILRSSMK